MSDEVIHCKCKRTVFGAPPKDCPIKPIPVADPSVINDNYCTGWDKAVSIVTKMVSDSNGKTYRFYLPAGYKECKNCKVKGPEPCDCLFAQGTALDPNKRFFAKRRILEQCQGLDFSSDPAQADYASGFRDALEWITEEFGLTETEEE